MGDILVGNTAFIAIEPFVKHYPPETAAAKTMWRVATAKRANADATRFRLFPASINSQVPVARVVATSAQ